MSGIRGIVLLTRFDFIEDHYGHDRLKKFIAELARDEHKDVLGQPIVISKEYSEALLKAIDERILSTFFDGQVQKFKELGEWNARQVVPRYFQVYMDEKNPGGFLSQLARLRGHLIGLGEMHVSAFTPNEYGIRISYGQPYSEPVKLNELGFLEEGCRLCAARNLTTQEVESTDITVEYILRWE